MACKSVSLDLLDNIADENSLLAREFQAFLLAEPAPAPGCPEADVLKEAYTRLVIGERVRTAAIWLLLCRKAALGEIGREFLFGVGAMLAEVESWKSHLPIGHSERLADLERRTALLHGRMAAIQRTLERRRIPASARPPGEVERRKA